MQEHGLARGTVRKAIDALATRAWSCACRGAARTWPKTTNGIEQACVAHRGLVIATRLQDETSARIRHSGPHRAALSRCQPDMRLLPPSASERWQWK